MEAPARYSAAAAAPIRISPAHAGVAQYRGVGPPDPGDDRRRHAGHDGGGDDEPGRGRTGATTAEANGGEQGERPQPVELLLDRQRPVVVERGAHAGLLADQVAVAAAGAELHPVVDLGEGGDEVAVEVGDTVEQVGAGGEHDAAEAEQAGGQQAASAAGIERADPDRRPERSSSSSSSRVIRNPESVKNSETPR